MRILLRFLIAPFHSGVLWHDFRTRAHRAEEGRRRYRKGLGPKRRVERWIYTLPALPCPSGPKPSSSRAAAAQPGLAGSTTEPALVDTSSLTPASIGSTTTTNALADGAYGNACSPATAAATRAVPLWGASHHTVHLAINLYLVKEMAAERTKRK